MQIAFLKKEFRDLCINEHMAISQYGLEFASKLLVRIADLQAASTASDIFFLPGINSPSIDGDPDIISIGLLGNQYLSCMSGHPNSTKLDLGVSDWTKVRRIKIIGIREAS